MIPQEVADLADLLQEEMDLKRDEAITVANRIYAGMHRKGWGFQQVPKTSGFRTT